MKVMTKKQLEAKGFQFRLITKRLHRVKHEWDNACYKTAFSMVTLRRYCTIFYYRDLIAKPEGH